MKHIVTICLFSALHFGAVSQKPFYTTYQIFDEKDGYQTFGRPAFITTDKQGLLWIGGDNGLYRFDGTHFKNYRHEVADTHSLPFNLVTFNYQDRHGNYWVAVANFGLYRFFPETGAFKKWQFANENRFSIHSYQLALPFEDRFGRLWFVIPNFGLARWDHQTNLLHPYPICEPKSCGTYYSVSWATTAIEDRRDSTFWLASNDGLVHFFPASGRFRVFRDRQTRTASGSLSGNIFNQLYFDDQHRLWLGTWGRGLKTFDPVTSTFDEYKWSRNADGNGNICTGISRYDSGTLWITSYDQGLMLFDIHRKSFIPVKSISKGDMQVYPVRAAQTGPVLWVADARRLIRINTRENRFAYYPLDEKSLVQDKYVGAFLKKDRILYFGSFYNGHFNQYDVGTGKSSVIPLTPHTDDESVHAIREDASGTLWIASHAGSFLYDPDKKRLWQPEKGRRARKLFHSACYDILLARNGTAWLATQAGLLHYDYKHDSLVRYPVHGAIRQKSLANIATKLFEDSKGNVWLGGNWGRLGCYRKETGDIVYLDGLLARSSVPYNYNSITEAADGSILFVVEYMGLGILKFPFTGKQEFHLVNSAQGLPADYIGQIFKDDKGRILMTTANGLCLYEPLRSRSTAFTQKDGLIENFSEGALYQDAQGLMYVGFSGCFQTFNPDSLLRHRSPPARIFISDFLVNGKTQHINQSAPNPLRLNYRENNLRFDFAALSPIFDNDFHYAYKLDEVDKQWMQTGTRAWGQYAALPPGNYTLHIKAAGRDDQWLQNQFTLQIAIRPPWYQTGWFYAALVLLIVSLAYAFYRYRINRLLELQRIRMRIASDLHDDIGSSLSSIAYNSELVKMELEDKDSKAVQLLDKLEQTSRGILASMSDIVWFISPNNDSAEGLTNRLKYLAGQMLTERGIPYTFRQPENAHDGLLTMQQRKNILLIFKEALHNAVKHSGCTKVDISLQFESHAMQLIVSDNGKGFNPANDTNGNGLYSMKNRAKEIKADLVIESVQRGGTSVILKVDRIH